MVYLMLVLEIPQTNIFSIFFELNLRHIISCIVRIFFLINWVFQCLKKFNTFWPVNVLVEAEIDQSTDSCMSCHLS